MRNTNQSKIQSVLKCAIANRNRSAALVFAIIVVAGGGYSFIGKMFKGEVKSATSVEQTINTGKIPGWWYNDNFGASVCEDDKCDPDSDPDKDKLTNYQEYFYSSDPNNRDTNANGNIDGEDVALGFVPNKPGKITFDEAGTDENILGESLAYNNEVKEIISGMTDFSKVVLPEISDAELNIVKENSKDAFVDYILALNEISTKYANTGIEKGLDNAIKQQNESILTEVTKVSLQIADDYKRIAVPQEAVTLHKYHISLWQTLPKVIRTPAPDAASSFEGVFNEEINTWYDSVQTMISLNQKILPELQSLRNKYAY